MVQEILRTFFLLNYKIAPSTNIYWHILCHTLLHMSFAIYSLHCIQSIVLHALKLCFLFYASCFMYLVLSILFYVSFSIHLVLCILFYASCFMYLLLSILFYVSCYMHLVLFILCYASWFMYFFLCILFYVFCSKHLIIFILFYISYYLMLIILFYAHHY